MAESIADNTLSKVEDRPADSVPDSKADTRWMSYDELAELTGAKRESVIRIVRRKKWPRREGNRPGEVRVAVPAEVLADMRARKPDPPGVPPDMSGTINALQDHVTTLREQLTRAETTIDRERDRADRAESRADRLQEQIAMQTLRSAESRELTIRIPVWAARLLGR